VIARKSVCQSCGSPILRDLDKGSEKNGDPSENYCRRCYRMGSFTDPQMTAEKMREIVQLKMLEMKFPRFLARMMANHVTTLKRWETHKA
jgi:Putative zinc ribbon domain